MEASRERADPPYVRIVDEIRRRITSGELRAGDRVPSTRRIVQEWGVAMATASKVLSALRQEGLVHAVPGVGTVVSAPAGRGRRPAVGADRGPEPGHVLSRERVVGAAVAIADSEGLDALTMRRVAAQLDVGVMSLYRHVPSREELTLLMMGEVFERYRLPGQVPSDWRAGLELMARRQWEIYRQHPWVARIVSFTRPRVVRAAMAHTEWGLRVLDGSGLDVGTMIHAVVTLSAFVRGMGASRSAEVDEENDTGVTAREWIEARNTETGRILRSGDFPMLSRLDELDDESIGLEEWFEFGLQRHLDGLEVHFGRLGVSRRAAR
ncbi:TetR/AcrR family transcriptional regulator C-terminal domain-containing protein [Saccharopolyspora erythraea]|uniref:TetR/AcrR family transcriptional regulator C-terminal domain-containing protein n=1 Tax=Saccharopolyspora erythraea TaxID=1836 RepID=UPI001BA95C42|nr:TetR/AcrR family transcriptional regulator C-terminal domain-containing protein [Saccharopolyspora erythraea]QUH03120.1 TetR/AcrR family transcriptional regulator C-terminal domain-containing protein [Saccharopolyspora erythraea]